VGLLLVHATAIRTYLSTKGSELAKLLASAGIGEERILLQQFADLVRLLEPVEKVELLSRGDATGFKFMLRMTTVKPLK
jgi:hypothetical protein